MAGKVGFKTSAALKTKNERWRPDTCIAVVIAAVTILNGMEAVELSKGGPRRSKAGGLAKPYIAVLRDFTKPASTGRRAFEETLDEWRRHNIKPGCVILKNR